MDYRLLGRSGLKVSALSIGTATFGGDGLWGATDVADAQRQIDLCLDHGVNLIDTANVYGGSKSETIIGEALTDGRRDRLLIATKVRFRRGTGPNDEGLSRWHIIRECENSLKRMKTDVIDLYQVHQWDGSTPLEETVAALDSLITQGKVRYVGCSNYSGWQLMKALGIADAHHQQRFVSQQIHYTLQAREAEYELIPLGLDQGVSLLVWSPLAGGWLTGKYQRDTTPTGESRLGEDPERGMEAWGPRNKQERTWAVIDAVGEVAAEAGVTSAQVALAWVGAQPAVTSVILGARTVDQLTDNLAAADLDLTAAQLDRLSEVSAPQADDYPYGPAGVGQRHRDLVPSTD
jgi:aryl-alcohol dehydrogenase-like predicted oxidoreductase